jgi:response regulator of citrate/malate metabolism
MDAGEGMKRILVADVPQMDARYSAALEGWELAHVRTVSQACAALDGAHYDLVAIGVYFDDSRMFDMVRVIRSDDVHGEVPIVCARGHPGFTAVTGRTLELTLKALAADEFVDLLHYGEDEAGNAALRAAVQRLLFPDR